MRPPVARPGAPGFSLISVVLTLLLAGMFYVGYIRLDDAADQSVDTIAEAQAVGQTVACRMNRRTIEQSIFSWTIGHPDQRPSIEALRRSGFHVPQCPEGGSYEVVETKVICRLHAK